MPPHPLKTYLNLTASLPSPSPKRNFPNFLTPKNSAMENLKFPQKSFDHDLCYFPEYPHPAPSPFLHWDHNRKRSLLFLLTFAVFVCQLVCVFKYSLFYVFDLMMTATLRIYTKIQLSCIFGYCFIAAGRERPVIHARHAIKKKLSFEYSLRLI